MGFEQVDEGCFAFAQVTYEAGVAVCRDCRISSAWTVQNDTALELEADALTTEALWLMPEIISFLVLTNSSIPPAGVGLMTMLGACSAARIQEHGLPLSAILASPRLP